jgi:hypothetical protein
MSETALWHVIDRDPTTQGNCQPELASIRALRASRKTNGKFTTTLLPQRTTYMSQLYSARSIPALPPDWNAIILARKVGTGPVGVSHLIK